jgi:hypothetical protein
MLVSTTGFRANHIMGSHLPLGVLILRIFLVDSAAISTGRNWMIVSQIFLFTCASSPPAAAAFPNANNCIQVVRADKGTMCGADNSLDVVLINLCPAEINAQLCIMGFGGLIAACGSFHNMPPAKPPPKSGAAYQLEAYACHSNGAYRYWGCSDTSPLAGNCGSP